MDGTKPSYYTGGHRNTTHDVPAALVRAGLGPRSPSRIHGNIVSMLRASDWGLTALRSLGVHWDCRVHKEVSTLPCSKISTTTFKPDCGPVLDMAKEHLGLIRGDSGQVLWRLPLHSLNPGLLRAEAG